MSFALVAGNAWEVLADYNFESAEFWEPRDTPWKRLKAVTFPHPIDNILKSVYVNKWGDITDLSSLTTMGLIQSICVAEWHDRELKNQEDHDFDSDSE